MAQTIKNLLEMWENRVQSLVRKIWWRREWQPTPVSLPGEFHGQRSLEGYSPWDLKESDMTEWLTHTPISHASGTSKYLDGIDVSNKDLICPLCMGAVLNKLQQCNSYNLNVSSKYEHSRLGPLGFPSGKPPFPPLPPPPILLLRAAAHHCPTDSKF